MSTMEILGKDELMGSGTHWKGGPRAKYPYQEWADGRVRRAVRGVDFDSTATQLRATMNRWALRNGFNLQTREERGNGTESLVFQFTPRG